MNTAHKNSLNNEKGFTLVEVIAVLIILGILAAVAVPKYIGLEENAKSRAIDAGISELNGRESLYWANASIDTDPAKKYKQNASDVVNDTTLFTRMVADGIYELNPDGTPAADKNYIWTAGPVETGGSLQFQKGTAVTLTRTPSTSEKPGSWKR